MPRVELTRIFKFDASHSLPEVGGEHKCSRLHGHTFRLELTISGEMEPRKGWLMDFGDIAQAVAPVLETLDHSYLNEIPGLQNPTSEMLAVWVWKELKEDLPLLSAVTVHESESSRCTYRGE